MSFKLDNRIKKKNSTRVLFNAENDSTSTSADRVASEYTYIRKLPSLSIKKGSRNFASKFSKDNRKIEIDMNSSSKESLGQSTSKTITPVRISRFKYEKIRAKYQAPLQTSGSVFKLSNVNPGFQGFSRILKTSPFVRRKRQKSLSKLPKLEPKSLKTSRRFKIDNTQTSKQRRCAEARQSNARLITPPGVFLYRRSAAENALYRRLNGEKSGSIFKLDRKKKAEAPKTSVVPKRRQLKLDNRKKESRRSLSLLTKYKLARSSLSNTSNCNDPKVVHQTAFYKYSIEKAKYTLRKKNQLCQFFIRFGTCKRGSKCLYLHDKRKVAICKKFLKGVCDNSSSCLLSHTYTRDRLPACEFFLRGDGKCSRAMCPYPHVRYSPGAPICPNFRKGYCSAGMTCPKRHEWTAKAKKHSPSKINLTDSFFNPEKDSLPKEIVEPPATTSAPETSISPDDSCPFFIPLPSLDDDWSVDDDCPF